MTSSVFYQCSICKLKYADKRTAQACEAWCSTHASCNVVIARQAINKDEASAMPVADDERYKPAL